MKKETMSNVMQRCLIICCVALVAMTVVFTRGNEAKAWDEKSQSCSLESITVEIEGKQYTFEEGGEPMVVVGEDDWSDILSTIKIVDYTIVTDDVCTCDDHDLTFSLWGEYNDKLINDFLTYENGVSTNALQADDTQDIGSYSYYDFYYDGKFGMIDIFLAKEYDIKYELGGGSFPTYMEVPTKYNTAEEVLLPVPEREGYIFKGWTCTEDEDPVIEKFVDGITGELTCTAHWEEGERIDISSYGLEYTDICAYRGEEITPYVGGVFYQESEDSEKEYLIGGKDYTYYAENNIEVADADSETPPTIIIKGIGKYEGTIERTFSIIKSSLWSSSSNLSIGKGDALSTVDLSGLKVYANSNDKVVPGTWAWSEPDTIVDAEIGEKVYYKATFTPTDTKNYETLTKDIYLIVKASMKDWEISFAGEETFSYTGEAHKPAVTVVSGETTMKEGTDYGVSYVNNVNVADKSGKDAPTVVVKGKGDYFGTKELTFTIEKATPTVETAPVASAIEEGKKLSDSTLTGGKVVNAKGDALEGVFSWKDRAVVPTLADSNVTKYTVVFTPKDANYNTVETTIVVTVNEKAKTPEQTEDLNPSPDPAPNPTPDPSPGSQPTVTVGDKVTDKADKATYQVTKSAEGKVEVSYVAPTSKTKKVTIPATVTLADGTTAEVTAIATGAFKKNTKLQEVTIGKNVKTIGKDAFNGCKNLKKVKSAKNVTTIGKNAFANCTKLSSVAMSTQLISIGEKAFYNCKSLKKITIPKNVNSIGKSAFQNCKNLKSIKINTTKLTKKNVKKNAFKGIHSKVEIDVPNSKKKAYKSMLKARGIGEKTTIK